MDYKPECKKRCITNCFKHKFSIDAILGISPTDFTTTASNTKSSTTTNSNSHQNIRCEQAGIPGTEHKTVTELQKSYTHLSSSAKMENASSEKPTIPSLAHTAATTDSPVNHFWQTFSILNAPKTSQSSGFDTASLVGPEMAKNRSPRIPFSRVQLQTLEKKFQQTHYLSGWEVNHLARKLNLSETRVKIWFQNRRARERRDGGILNTADPSNSPQDHTPADKIDTKIVAIKRKSSDTEPSSDLLTFNNYIDNGNLTLTNPTDCYAGQIETTINSSYPYNLYPNFGFPLRLTSTNWNQSPNSVYYSARPIYYPLAGSSTISSGLPYQPSTEQSVFGQTSFWRPHNYDRSMDMNSCNSNLVTCTAFDQKQFI